MHFIEEFQRHSLHDLAERILAFALVFGGQFHDQTILLVCCVDASKWPLATPLNRSRNLLLVLALGRRPFGPAKKLSERLKLPGSFTYLESTSCM